MPRLGRTPLLRKQYRWSLNSDNRRATPREVEQDRLDAARRAGRGSV